MKFVNVLMQFLSDSVAFLGNLFSKLLEFLAVPLGWIVSFLEGIWYFLTVLFDIVVAVIKIFVALFQFLGALAVGFFKTIKMFLVPDFSRTPIHYPGGMKTGMDEVIKVVDPVGFLDVVPLIFLAVIWLLFIIRLFGLLGGDVKTDA
ncbi:hypothetical protein [Brevibacillus reuszeri]|uniref:hypothetical protein n=1 Tax=Brevibacillus reuszeri TaxID=54915 RepID=UPI000CCC9C91|nr:hypothetical protein [Brevibacillus reuszeri]